MTDEILIPSPDNVLTPVLEKMYEVRPSCFKHLNLRRGVYWHPILGYRAQVALMLERLSDRAKNHRLKTAEGQALLDYVASEFEAITTPDPTFAEGTIYLTRNDLTAAMPSGDYPKGTRVSRSQTTSLGVTYLAAEYETLADAHVELNGTDEIAIPIRATRAGTHANSPIVIGVDSANGVSIAALVQNMKVSRFEAGGGADKPDDEFVRAFARSYGRGQYGPTDDASKLGALSGAGVRRYLVYGDPILGTQTVLLADFNWGSSTRWAKMVQQYVYDADLVGFGCKVVMHPITNRAISVTAEVALRYANDLVETTELDDAVRKAARSYFDDRPDWNLWNEDALKVAISRSHPRILNCNSVTVKDVYVPEGGFFSDPQEVLVADYTTPPQHLLLASNAMKISYVGPA